MFKYFIITLVIVATFGSQCSEPVRDSELTASQKAAFAALARTADALPAEEAATYNVSIAKLKERLEDEARKKAILEGRRESMGPRRTKSELNLVTKTANTDLGAPRAGRK